MVGPKKKKRFWKQINYLYFYQDQVKPHILREREREPTLFFFFGVVISCFGDSYPFYSQDYIIIFSGLFSYFYYYNTNEKGFLEKLLGSLVIFFGQKKEIYLSILKSTSTPSQSIWHSRGVLISKCLIRGYCTQKEDIGHILQCCIVTLLVSSPLLEPIRHSNHFMIFVIQKEGPFSREQGPAITYQNCNFQFHHKACCYPINNKFTINIQIYIFKPNSQAK